MKIKHNTDSKRTVEINHPEDCLAHPDKGWFGGAGHGYCSRCVTGKDEADSISSWAGAEEVFCENCDRPVVEANAEIRN